MVSRNQQSNDKGDAQKEQPAAPQVERKLTTKTIIGKVTKPDKPTALYRVWGRANGLRTGSTQFGEFVAMIGTFEAVRLSDGVYFKSSQCILPAPYGGPGGMLSQAVKDNTENGRGGVDFALEIGVKPDEESTTGYVYVTDPLREASATDELKSLRDVATKSLPAPAASE